MPKPKKVGANKLGLSKAVKSALAEHGGKPFEYGFVEPAVAEHLLGKLKLPEEKIAKAKIMAAHNTRLLEASAQAANRQPITVKSARKIIKIALEEIPGFVERNQGRLDEAQAGRLRTLQRNLEVDLERMRSWSDDWHSGLSPEFLQDATNFHFDEMKHRMGKRKFDAYISAIRRTLKVLAERKK